MATKGRPLETVGEVLFCSYANLAMAHSAVTDGLEKYGRLNYIIRARLNKGLCSGTMNIGSMLDDERLKMKLPQCCAYCGSAANLTLVHLIPRIAGGKDTGDNLVWACRACNSSKGGRDLMVWMNANQRFPPLMILRRFLKLAIEHCAANGLLDHPLSEPAAVPFDLGAIPIKYPPPAQLVLWLGPRTT